MVRSVDPYPDPDSELKSGSRFRSRRAKMRHRKKFLVLRIRIRYPGSGAFLTPGSGIRDGLKNQDPDPGSGTGMKNPDLFLSAQKPFFWIKILKFFEVDPGSWMEKLGS
jgi:hypothetical protein